MKLTLTRTDFRKDGIFSVLEDEKNNIIAHVLEHSFDLKPKVYDGEFTCVRGEHQLDHGGKFETFEVTGVRGHFGILFHTGNFNSDSDGCLLLGSGIAQSMKGQMITNSRQTFEKFMDLMKNVNTFTLAVVTPNTGQSH